MAAKNGSARKAFVYGAASGVLYLLLFLYADLTVEWAGLTRDGQKLYFLLPILIAFLFSYVHGAFTGHFWDAIGFKPAQKLTNKGNRG